MDSTEMPLKRRKIGSGIGETSSSSSSISKNDYEVFLSFRGPDTRQSFTDCLYHSLINVGVAVFRDDDELPPGSKIEEILHGLDNSKICIVVLSPRFAESTWCLREVERMVGMKKDIVPIFYHVTPDDVKLKTDLYANDLTGHETKHGKQQVQQWRDALKEIPKSKGRELKNTGFVEFIRQITKEILTKLKVKHTYEIKNLVEVNDEVEAALKLLEIGSEGGRPLFIGIHGMGGIGKTTLAKIIYSQILDRFDCSCFMENIRDYSFESPNDRHKLQERLLKSLDPSIQDQIVDPVKMIQMTFQRKKVLIVLDDVDQQCHLDSLVGDSSWFGEGSKIIFTTRNAELHEKETSSDARFYGLEKKVMNFKQALQLFSRYAFGGDSPPKDFESLSNEAISTLGGLPLALQVVGSLLHRRKAKVWREIIKKLKETPHQDVQRNLKLSYDALNDEQQEMFLDIACFFIGEEKKNAIYMWEACEFDPNYGIEVLISMSLIKLDEKKCFLMHDQLRDLGRAIVKVTSKDARAGSRLWMHKDALDLLKRNAGKEKVEALHLEEQDSGYLNCENFIGLEKLRFMRLKKRADFGGDFGSLIPKLRWLSLRYVSCFNMSNLYLRELVVLELSCAFNETWSGWGQILISKQLKVLSFSCCMELISTPDLSEVVNLERLVIEYCSKLTSIHSSIGRLHQLRRLSIIECDSLRELPEDLTSLGSLKQILLRYGMEDFSCILPESISCLVSLTRLEVDGVANLPNSIGELVELKHLSLRGSKDLRVLPDSIGDLRSLISLDLSGSGITELPTTIDRLAKLESLCLSYCLHLERVPDSIGNLHSLIDLDMSNSLIEELPRSFGSLASLQKLNLTDSIVTSLPGSFRGLEKLERLDMGTVEDDIECWIRELDALPSGLTWLKVSFVEKINNLSNLINLSHLGIVNEVESEGSVELEGFEKLIKLKELEIKCCNVKSLSMDQWGALQQLKTLKLHCGSLEFGECQLPSNLESLLLHVKQWGKLPYNLCSMKNLRKLKLGNFVIDEGDWPVEGLECLEVLEMWSCSFPTMMICLDTPQLNHLVYLSISSNDDLVNIQGIGNLKSLTELCISRCDSLRTIEDISQWNRLASMDVSLCNNLVDIQGIARLKSLTRLDISWCPSLRRIEGFSELTRLASVKISYCSNLVDIQGIGNLKSLTELCISRCDSLRTIEDISQWNRLASMDVSLCNNLVDIQGIARLKSLTRLVISWCPSLRRIEGFSELNRLASVNISYCSNLVDIQGIGKLKSLATLNLCNCHLLRRIENLSELNGLETVYILRCEKFEGIDGGVDRLLSAGTLSKLDIMYCKCDNLTYHSSSKFSVSSA